MSNAFEDTEVPIEARVENAGERPNSPADSDAPESEPDGPVDVVAIMAQRDEYLETLQRVQAEFANYKKRVERDQTQMAERAAERLLEALLPVLDSFDLALVNLPETLQRGETDATKLRKGVELVFAEFLSVLERAGIKRMDVDGREFDPHEHEAVMQVDADEALEHPIVIETMRPGYHLHGRVLRPAMVKVAR